MTQKTCKGYIFAGLNSWTVQISLFYPWKHALQLCQKKIAIKLWILKKNLIFQNFDLENSGKNNIWWRKCNFNNKNQLSMKSDVLQSCPAFFLVSKFKNFIPFWHKDSEINPKYWKKCFRLYVGLVKSWLPKTLKFFIFKQWKKFLYKFFI